MLRTLEATRKERRVDRRFGRRLCWHEPHKVQDAFPASIRFMISNQTGGTIDSARVRQAETGTPANPRVFPLRARLHAVFQSTLWMVLVALAIRLIVMGFLYQEQLDPDRNHWRFARLHVQAADRDDAWPFQVFRQHLLDFGTAERPGLVRGDRHDGRRPQVGRQHDWVGRIDRYDRLRVRDPRSGCGSGVEGVRRS